MLRRTSAGRGRLPRPCAAAGPGARRTLRGQERRRQETAGARRGRAASAAGAPCWNRARRLNRARRHPAEAAAGDLYQGYHERLVGASRRRATGAVLPCTTVRKPVLLFLLALGVRLVLFAALPRSRLPGFLLLRGRRPEPGSGPRLQHRLHLDLRGGRREDARRTRSSRSPAMRHWMPLASLVQVPVHLAPGTDGACVGAAVRALRRARRPDRTWAIARDAGASRAQSRSAPAILAAIPALATPFMAQPDNFGAVPAAGRRRALDGRARPAGPRPRPSRSAGSLVGLATLARNDGVLVGAALGLAFVWDRWRAWRSGGPRRRRYPCGRRSPARGCSSLVVAPWLARQLAVFGSLSPSSSSGKVLFIRSIGEWNSITTPATLEYFLGQGIGPLLASRVDGLVAAIDDLLRAGGGRPARPVHGHRRLAAPALARLRGRSSPTRRILFAFSVLVFAVHVPGGTFIHSAVALAPGRLRPGAGGARRVRRLDRRPPPELGRCQATRVFSARAVAFAVVAAVAATLATHAGVGGQCRRPPVRRGGAGCGGRTAHGPASCRSTRRARATGAGGAASSWSTIRSPRSSRSPVPTRSAGSILQRASAPPAIAPILDGTARPAWIGPPVASKPAAPPPAGGALPPGFVDVAVYPVCVVPGDTRCASAAAGPATSALP